MNSSKMLQSSRRVDWRFLLPDVNLKSVGYLGPENCSLLDSLSLLSGSVKLVDLSNQLFIDKFDVVVVKQSSYESVECAANLVRPDGFLYVEVEGITRLNRIWLSKLRDLVQKKKLLISPNDYVAFIKGQGFTEIMVHWHWPDFEACTRLIPLHSQAAVHYALSLGESNLKTSFRNAIGKGMLRNGLLNWFVPCFSVIAQR
jgi:hypothetical protein